MSRVDMGLCVTCGKPARKDNRGVEKVFCAEHAKKSARNERAKRGMSRRYACSICGRNGHNKQSHDLYSEAS